MSKTTIFDFNLRYLHQFLFSDTKLVILFVADSACEDEKETEEGSLTLNKIGLTETYIDMPRTDTTTTTFLLEKPHIDKKVKVSPAILINFPICSTK